MAKKKFPITLKTSLLSVLILWHFFRRRKASLCEERGENVSYEI